MASCPVIVPTYTQPIEKNCIVVDYKKYCEDSKPTPKEFGTIFLIIILIITWAILPIFIIDPYSDYAGYKLFVWYFVPPVILSLFLILS